MSIIRLINRPCTLTIRTASDGEADDYGDVVEGEATVDTVCEVQQVTREEPGGSGEFSIGQWRGFFLPGTAGLDTADALDVPGLGHFEFVGDPWTVRNPRSATDSHVEATLKRTDGETS